MITSIYKIILNIICELIKLIVEKHSFFLLKKLSFN